MFIELILGTNASSVGAKCVTYRPTGLEGKEKLRAINMLALRAFLQHFLLG